MVGSTWFWFWFCGYLERGISNNLAKTVAPETPLRVSKGFGHISMAECMAYGIPYSMHLATRLYCICTLTPGLKIQLVGWLVGWCLVVWYLVRINQSINSP
jgi:hypothetical protein